MLSWYVAQVLSEWFWNGSSCPIITSIALAFKFHVRWICVMRSLYFKIFSASFLITFLSPGIAASNMHVPFLLWWIMISGLLLGIVLLVHTCWFHNMVTLHSWLVLTDFSIWSYQCLLSNFTSVSLHMLKCNWAHTLSCLFMYCSFANSGHADMMCSAVSSKCLQSLHLLSVCVCFFFFFSSSSPHLLLLPISSSFSVSCLSSFSFPCLSSSSSYFFFSFFLFSSSSSSSFSSLFVLFFLFFFFLLLLLLLLFLFFFLFLFFLLFLFFYSLDMEGSWEHIEVVVDSLVVGWRHVSSP